MKMRYRRIIHADDAAVFLWRNGMNKVLIIDDDKELCALVKRCLLAEGMEADCCCSGAAGIKKLDEETYLLVILDVMMPGPDGFRILEEIRKKSSLPVLMLTAKGDAASRVRGLRAGADDYVAKPFDMEELVARAISLIRRYTRFNRREGEEEVWRFEGLVIDPDNRTAAVEGGTFELPPKEFDVLVFLAKNQGRIVTKQQIYEAVWGEPYVYDDSNIMAIISRLRKKLERDAGHPVYIQTVKGVGYRFNREV